jgi:hypothetical protein
MSILLKEHLNTHKQQLRTLGLQIIGGGSIVSPRRHTAACVLSAQSLLPCELNTRCYVHYPYQLTLTLQCTLQWTWMQMSSCSVLKLIT